LPNVEMNEFPLFASVIPDLAIQKPLDYGIPQPLVDQVTKGVHVEIPVRGFLCKGYIYQLKEKPDFQPVLPIAKVLSETPLIPADLFELAVWMSSYYCAPLRQVLKMMLPPSVRMNKKQKEQKMVLRLKSKEELKEGSILLRNKAAVQANVLDVMLQVKKGIFLSELEEKVPSSRDAVMALCKKGYLKIENVAVDRSPLANAEYFKTVKKTLNGEQSAAFASISASIDREHFCTHLLHGVTGSGKTEVYLQAIDFALQKGRGGIMLVPEISLTAQTIERFRSRFEGHIAILHHRLSAGERLDEWKRVQMGRAKIVIGARSAVFSPVNNLGLIIVDEEHETSYKQSEEAPCYHARDIAVMRAHLAKACVVLGSATPSLESYYNAQSGKYTLSTLSARPDSAKLPLVRIVDMKQEFERGNTNFSELLLEGIKKRFASGEQSILFLNRRGYHTTLFCPSCSQVIQCPHCDLALTFHFNAKTLACHMCGYSLSPPPLHCLHCQTGVPMKFRGVGTEQIERALHAIFPEIRTIRLDADTTRHKGSHEKLLRQFGTGKADVLIGTQMVAKGLHFSEVTLVGVINSDSGLHIPDYRASESVFQLITQVAGRSGRGVLPGEVVIQTFMPDNRIIALAAKQDYPTFYKEEIETRKVFHYPPFTKMVKITFSGMDQALTQEIGNRVHTHLSQALSSHFAVHPVIPSGHAKIKNLYRFQCLIRGPSVTPINRALESLRERLNIPAKIKILIDVNPISTF
jgi:primosomal protein N' (replication factor Y) (superfamily II helicase)